MLKITLFFQVQLLVSNEDVENYCQIDRDLFILKILTEKSELWVNAGKASESPIIDDTLRIEDISAE